MAEEIKTLKDNQTWELVSLPSNNKSTSVYEYTKSNMNPIKLFKRYKPRFVVKDYNQKEGLDYHESFAPVAKLTTLRSLVYLLLQRLKMGIFTNLISVMLSSMEI